MPVLTILDLDYFVLSLLNKRYNDVLLLSIIIGRLDKGHHFFFQKQ
jgi:hypothetical protein